MPQDQASPTALNISYCSSSKDSVWHDLAGVNAFEYWRFDAVSDDGREVLVISFYDNYPLSPRYYKNEWRADDGPKARFPAVSFVYSVGGRIILSSLYEFRPDQFTASPDVAGCNLGASSFNVDTAEYGSGYMIRIDIGTFRKRRIKAELEWLAVESDLLSANDAPTATTWNMSAPRSDVSGRITLVGQRGKTRKLIQFRGTGYCDHLRSEESLGRALGPRLWGRAHFVDTTAIFCHDPVGAKIFLVKDGTIHERAAAVDRSEIKRDRFGLKIPRRITLASDDNIRLRVKPASVIRSGFSEVSMLSEITLGLRDGKPRKTLGITEFVEPWRMKSRLIRLLSNLRIGTNGRPPIF